MATQAEKIEKLKKEVQSMKDTLTKYQKLFAEDGEIDSEEQKQLDKLQTVIIKIEKKIAELQGNSKTDDKPETVSDKPWDALAFNKFIDEVKAALDEMEQRLGL
ncbi:MAG: hypothetical protein AB8E82_19955 [Aureispira sp.]